MNQVKCNMCMMMLGKPAAFTIA